MKPSREQFEQLALAELDTVYRVARRLARNLSTADDLVQDTYARAIRSWETFSLDDSRGIKPWLLRILHNVHLTRGPRENRQPDLADEQQLASARVSEDVPPLSEGSWEGMDERLLRALNGLEVQYRTILILWALEDLTYKEIVEVLGIPIGTVMSRLHRARQLLSQQLRSLAVDEGIIRE